MFSREREEREAAVVASCFAECEMMTMDVGDVADRRAIYKYYISDEVVRTGRRVPSVLPLISGGGFGIVWLDHRRRPLAALSLRPPCRSYLRSRAPRTQCITSLMFAEDFAAGIYVGMPGATPFQNLPQQKRSSGALHLTHAPPSPAAAKRVGAPHPQHCS